MTRLVLLYACFISMAYPSIAQSVESIDRGTSISFDLNTIKENNDSIFIFVIGGKGTIILTSMPEHLKNENHPSNLVLTLDIFSPSSDSTLKIGDWVVFRNELGQWVEAKLIGMKDDFSVVEYQNIFRNKRRIKIKTNNIIKIIN